MSKAQLLRLSLCIAIGWTTLIGCSSAYDAALKDLSKSGDERMRMRIDELLRCSDHTLRSLDEAVSLYRRPARGSSEQAKLDASVNETEAGVFQLNRRALSVQDAAREMERQNDEIITRVLHSVDECRARVTLVITALRVPLNDAAAGMPPGQLFDEARQSVATLHKNASAVIAAQP